MFEFAKLPDNSTSGQPMYPKTFGKMTHPTDALSRNFMQADESWS